MDNNRIGIIFLIVTVLATIIILSDCSLDNHTGLQSTRMVVNYDDIIGKWKENPNFCTGTGIQFHRFKEDQTYILTIGDEKIYGTYYLEQIPLNTKLNILFDYYKLIYWAGIIDNDLHLMPLPTGCYRIFKKLKDTK